MSFTLTKPEITQAYINMIEDRLRYMNDYKDYIKKQKEKLLDLSKGNRGIEEIEEEIQEMEIAIKNIIDITEDVKSSIIANESRF